MRIIIYVVIATLLLFAACVQQDKGEVSSLDIHDTAKKISSGEIDVGDEFGMETGERYHTIHVDTLGLKCTACHVSEYAPDDIYQRKYKVPVRGAPGVVDRGICLDCHKQNGPAMTKLYGTASE